MFGAIRKTDEEKIKKHYDAINDNADSYYEALRAEGYSENVIKLFSFLQNLEIKFINSDPKYKLFLRESGQKYAKNCAEKILKETETIPEFKDVHNKLSEKDFANKSLIERIFFQREKYLENETCELLPASTFNDLEKVYESYCDKKRKDETDFYETLIDKDYPEDLIRIYLKLNDAFEEYEKTQEFKLLLKTATQKERFKSFSEDYLKKIKELEFQDLHRIFSSPNPENGNSFLMDLLMQRADFLKERNPEKIKIDAEKLEDVIKSLRKIDKLFLEDMANKNRQTIETLPSKEQIEKISKIYSFVDNLREEFAKTAKGKLCRGDQGKFKEWLSEHDDLVDLKKEIRNKASWEKYCVEALLNMSFKVSEEEFIKNISLFYVDENQDKIKLYQTLAGGVDLKALDRRASEQKQNRQKFNQNFATILNGNANKEVVSEAQVKSFFDYIDDLEQSFLISKDAEFLRKKIDQKPPITEQDYEKRFSKWLLEKKFKNITESQYGQDFKSTLETLSLKTNNGKNILQEMLEIRRLNPTDKSDKKCNFGFNRQIKEVILKYDKSKKFTERKEQENSVSQTSLASGVLAVNLNSADKKKEQFYSHLEKSISGDKNTKEDIELIIKIYKSIDKMNEKKSSRSRWGRGLNSEEKELEKIFDLKCIETRSVTIRNKLLEERKAYLDLIEGGNGDNDLKDRKINGVLKYFGREERLKEGQKHFIDIFNQNKERIENFLKEKPATACFSGVYSCFGNSVKGEGKSR